MIRSGRLLRTRVLLVSTLVVFEEEVGLFFFRIGVVRLLGLLV